VAPCEGCAAPIPESPYAGYPPPALCRPAAAPSCDAAPACPDCEFDYYTWASVEDLYWKIKNPNIPFPLATTGAPSLAAPGLVGRPDTIVLIGNRDVDFGTASGVRVGVGLYDAERNIALEARVFRLEDMVQRYSARSDDTGSPVISRPFRD